MRMRAKTILRIGGLLAALGIGFGCFFWLCHRNGIDRVFDGSKIKNPDRYLLDFSYMDQSDSHTMDLARGDTVQVAYEVRDGRVDVTVGISGHDPIYRGDDVQAGEFELRIEETGRYVISVHAGKASGWLEFERES